MKRFWFVWLSLGLITVFSASAFAVDVKSSGEYYVAGMYLNKTKVDDADTNPSTAFFYQRLRVRTDFIVSPGLKLVTRFDTLERIWGGARSTPGTTLASDSAGTRAENENIALDWAYVDYVSPIGTITAGYMQTSDTGTDFGNNVAPNGRLKYTTPAMGPFVIDAKITKKTDSNWSYNNNPVGWTDGDSTVYEVQGKYKWTDGVAGLQIGYSDNNTKRPPSSGNYSQKYLVFTPYVIAKIGPVALQAEFNYATGDYKKYDQPDSHTDVKLENISGWVDATATFAPVYVGATVAYVSGDKPDTSDKKEGGALNGGRDWNPCLIMFNYYDVAYWAGDVQGHNGSKLTGPMENAWFFQGRVGVKPKPEIDAMLSVSHAVADVKPQGYPNSTYGTEVDLTGTYKITNNLSYTLGVGYLFTGDYFKGEDAPGTKVNDDYIVMNKLTLTF
jgi:hypothetical protein